VVENKNNTIQETNNETEQGDIYVTTIQVAVRANGSLEAAQVISHYLSQFALDWQYLTIDGQILYPTIKLVEPNKRIF
jgi:hypothetical protein